MAERLAFRVEIDEEGLSARLIVDSWEGEAADGGAAALPVGVSALPDGIDATGLCELLGADPGLTEPDAGAIERILTAVRESAERSSGVVATGTAPVDGEDGRIDWRGDYFEAKPVRRPDGSTDFYHCNKCSVPEGTPIAVRCEPTEGSPGVSVTGAALPARAGDPIEIELDVSVRWSDEEESALVAVTGGRVEYGDGRLSICNLEEVESVDFTSGSIDFDGSVNVAGDVLDNFEVKARGAVEIQGFVQASTVEAGSSLRVKSGVVGHERARIRSGGDMELGYARDCRLACGGQLVAGGELLHCESEVDGNVTLERGRIVGGSWTIGKSLFVKELGSPSEVQTAISVGTIPSLEREFAALTEQRQKLDGILARAEAERDALQSGPGLADECRGERLSKVESQLERLEETMPGVQRQWSELKRKVTAHRRRGEVQVSGTLHAGVEIVAGGCLRPLVVTTTLRGPLRIGFAPGAEEPVVEKSGSKTPRS